MMKRFSLEASDIRIIVEAQTLSYERNSQFTSHPEAVAELGRRLRETVEEWIRELDKRHPPTL